MYLFAGNIYNWSSLKSEIPVTLRLYVIRWYIHFKICCCDRSVKSSRLWGIVTSFLIVATFDTFAINAMAKMLKVTLEGNRSFWAFIRSGGFTMISPKLGWLHVFMRENMDPENETKRREKERGREGEKTWAVTRDGWLWHNPGWFMGRVHSTGYNNPRHVSMRRALDAYKRVRCMRRKCEPTLFGVILVCAPGLILARYCYWVLLAQNSGPLWPEVTASFQSWAIADVTSLCI